MRHQSAIHGFVFLAFFFIGGGVLFVCLFLVLFLNLWVTWEIFSKSLQLFRFLKIIFMFLGVIESQLKS